MTRRDFIKGMAVLFASPAIAKLDIAEAREHIEYLGRIDGVMIDGLGVRIIKDAEGNEYPALVYHLKRGRYESYAEIGKALVDIAPDPEQFIRLELGMFAEGINISGGWA